MNPRLAEAPIADIAAVSDAERKARHGRSRGVFGADGEARPLTSLSTAGTTSLVGDGRDAITSRRTPTSLDTASTRSHVHAEPRHTGTDTPLAVDPTWTFVGFDVADGTEISGLSNCGYGAELEELRAAWAPRLNDRGLFEPAPISWTV